MAVGFLLSPLPVTPPAALEAPIVGRLVDGPPGRIVVRAG
jgi:hypothetical protein